MRGQSLHRLFVVVSIAAVALALAAVTPADGANPQGVHLTFSGTESQDDFCGTGKTVNDSFAIHLNVWNAPNQPSDLRNQSESKVVFTNPANGATVIVHSAYSFSDTLISGDPSGINVHEWVFKGNAELIRAADGGVLGHDRGNLVVDVTWNGPEFSGEFIGVEIVSDRGAHTLLGSDCNVMVPALGLT